MKFDGKALTLEEFQGRPPRGGRGLKSKVDNHQGKPMTSPPSRGAWIEIAGVFAGYVENRGRPPRGGRGLKWSVADHPLFLIDVAPLAGGVD